MEQLFNNLTHEIFYIVYSFKRKVNDYSTYLSKCVTSISLSNLIVSRKCFVCKCLTAHTHTQFTHCWHCHCGFHLLFDGNMNRHYLVIHCGLNYNTDYTLYVCKDFFKVKPERRFVILVMKFDVSYISLNHVDSWLAIWISRLDFETVIHQFSMLVPWNVVKVNFIYEFMIKDL